MSTELNRILVVDDELGMREGCRKILTSEGFEVEVAPDGLAGFETFQKQRNFVAAIVDMKMPRMGGIELIEAIRKLDEDIVLFVITAYATIGTAVEATKRGAYSYIPKPFTPDELLLPVKNGLEKRSLSLEAKRLRLERERRLLELAVERSKSSTIINCMTDAVLVVNRDRQIVLRNAAASRALPEAASVPLPAPLINLCCDELCGLVDETLCSESGPSIAIREIGLNGCTYMVNASPVLEPTGEVSGAVAVLRDITALKKLSVAKSMFVTMVAHEIKSPLAAIEGYLDVILSGAAGNDPQRDRQMLNRCVVRAKTLRTMVTELINLMSLQTGNFAIKRSRLDLHEVLDETVECYRERATAKHIEMSYQADTNIPPVLADREAMRSVFNNLLDNAVKYTPENGHVQVSLAGDGLYVKVAVKDDGIGLSPQDKEKLFEEFFRAKNKYTAQVPGTGLGLSLVKRLVGLHQGTVSVQTASGKGSEFVVCLPMTE